MKKFLSIIAVAGGLTVLSGVALAQWSGGPGPGRGWYGGMGPGMMWGGGPGATSGWYGHMGPGMMGGGGPGWMAGGAPCAGFTGTEAEITEDKAKELATAYADRYLKGFTVERVLPFTGRFHTMYSVELKNEAGEVRTLHVNPYGNVIPFGGPWRRNS